MKKILSVLIILVMAFTLLFTASAEVKVDTYFNANAVYPAGVEATKPYTGSKPAESLKGYVEESQPFTGTIVEEVTPAESNWDDDLFKGTEGDVAVDKANRDQEIANMQKPTKVLDPVTVVVIAVVAGVVIAGAVAIVLALLSKKKKAGAPAPAEEAFEETVAEETTAE